MEEIKTNLPSQDARKPYEAPTAEIILLAPQENLSADFEFHQDSSSYRWGIGGWADFFATDGLNDPASGTVGTVSNAWPLPDT